MTHRRLAWYGLVLILLLNGCAQMTKVTTGEILVKDRLAVTVDKPWNRFDRGTNDTTVTWTCDGLTVDALRFYVGLKDGELIAPTPVGTRPLSFGSTMQPAEIVALFEGLYTRGGSTFQLDKLAPEPFIGLSGFRFDFSSTRKSDDVRLRGIGWFVVRDGQLFAITFTAPRMAFFPQHAPSAEAIARSARVRS